MALPVPAVYHHFLAVNRCIQLSAEDYQSTEESKRETTHPGCEICVTVALTWVRFSERTQSRWKA